MGGKHYCVGMFRYYTLFLYFLMCGTILLYVESFLQPTEKDFKRCTLDIRHYQVHLPKQTSVLRKSIHCDSNRCDFNESRVHVIHFIIGNHSAGNIPKHEDILKGSFDKRAWEQAQLTTMEENIEIPLRQRSRTNKEGTEFEGKYVAYEK